MVITKTHFLWLFSPTQNRRRNIPKTHPQTRNPSQPKLKDLIIKSLDDDKAEEIEAIPLHNSTALADYMIVASGRSARQVSALADKLVERLHQAGYTNIRVEGQRYGDWVVVDAGDIIVHLFRPEVRAFYNIEKMWRSGPLFDVVQTAT